MFLLKQLMLRLSFISSIALHSTMFLLKRLICNRRQNGWKPLHSTMFLLKLIPPVLQNRHNFFTFHNVSIKTKLFSRHKNTFLSLHSTMFLLKPITQTGIIVGCCHFTFHNVSIKTYRTGAGSWWLHSSLHSTMFLLKLLVSSPTFASIRLYIPQCFY